MWPSVVAIFLMAFLVSGPALAALPPEAQDTSLCALPEVIRTLATELHRTGIDGRLDPVSVGERSDGGGAMCAIKLLRRGFDTDRYGVAPQYRLEVRTYRVRRLRNGLMVELTN